MSEAHSFGLSGSAIVTVTVVLFASATPAAEVKLPPPAALTKCVLPDPDAPLAATARCRDGTYSFGHSPGACSNHLGVAELLTRRADGKCAP
jgi:uncharacterized protein DUF3761